MAASSTSSPVSGMSQAPMLDSHWMVTFRAIMRPPAAGECDNLPSSTLGMGGNPTPCQETGSPGGRTEGTFRSADCSAPPTGLLLLPRGDHAPDATELGLRY